MADLEKRWTWIGDGDTLVDQNDDVVLAIDCPEFISDENRRLIAAAPALLAALEDAQQTIHGDFCGTRCNEVCRRYDALLRSLGAGCSVEMKP